LRYRRSKAATEAFSKALDQVKDIDALAEKMGLNVQAATDITFGSYYVPGAGVEPALLGSIFGSKPGVLSKPVSGNNGVYVFILDAVNPAPPPNDYSGNKAQLLSQLTSRVGSEVFRALKESGKVEDRRYKFDSI
jgi:peptidyl-prolyl cis-trans isomerase D